MPLYLDRRDAGRRLAEALSRLDVGPALVLGLARGGVIVAAEVARALRLPLDVLIVRKVGAPTNPEYAIGAVVEGGHVLLNRRTLTRLGLSSGIVRALVDEQESEARRLQAAYRGSSAVPSVEGRDVILVDDGLATGATMRAAVVAMRRQGVSRVVVACPVGSVDAASDLREVADTVVCLSTPRDFFAVGAYYERFDPVSDEEVRRSLREAGAHEPPTSDPSG